MLKKISILLLIFVTSSTLYSNPLNWIAKKDVSWATQKIAGLTLIASSVDHLVTKTKKPSNAMDLSMFYSTALASIAKGFSFILDKENLLPNKRMYNILNLLIGIYCAKETIQNLQSLYYSSQYNFDLTSVPVMVGSTCQTYSSLKIGIKEISKMSKIVISFSLFF